MNLSHLTSDTLKSLFKLTEKKDELIKEVEKIESQLLGLISVKANTSGGKHRARPAKRGPKAVRKAPKVPKPGAKHGRRSELGKKVLKALAEAGDAGVQVADLAKSLKVKGPNVHVWFATTGKKNKLIKKVGKGHYRLSK